MVLALLVVACGGAGAGGRELLGSLPAAETLPEPEALENPPASASFHAAPREATAYRLSVEWSGEREELVLDAERNRPVLRETHALELEYTENPVRGRADLYTVVLDGLHYRLSQTNPKVEREAELGSDRLRTRADGETQIDVRGAQPAGDLTPRKLLSRVFGTVRLDASGNVRAMRPQGTPAARRWLSDIPLLRAMAYARPALPGQELPLGSTWVARRLPVSPAGELGLLLEVRAVLGGFQRFEGVPCAWLHLDAEQVGEQVEVMGAMRFERVQARMRGEAFIELETSRIRLLQLEDDIRVSYARGDEIHRRLRHRTKIKLELRDPDVTPETWGDGSTRFGPR
ncbi:MAG: hypothetical protein ACR2P8_07065 [Myxococcota bacterium]